MPTPASGSGGTTRSRARRDAHYGPLVIVGLGGILAEALDEPDRIGAASVVIARR